MEEAAPYRVLEERMARFRRESEERAKAEVATQASPQIPIKRLYILFLRGLFQLLSRVHCQKYKNPTCYLFLKLSSYPSNFGWGGIPILVA